MKIRRSNGFTLLELLIVIAIVSILAVVAVPSYREYVRQSRRADAQGALMAFANAMERYYTEHNTYKGAGTDNDKTTGAPTIFPTEAPLDGNTKYYDLKINSADATSFVLHAVPKGAQAEDKCGTLTLDSLGNRGITGADAGVTAGDCWP